MVELGVGGVEGDEVEELGEEFGGGGDFGRE